MSLDKCVGDSGLFGGRQNSLFLAFFVGSYAVEPQNSTSKIHYNKLFGVGQKQGPGSSL